MAVVTANEVAAVATPATLVVHTVLVLRDWVFVVPLKTFLRKKKKHELRHNTYINTNKQWIKNN